jgi:tetratricopeptide (TPR) repeat protein
VDYAGQGLYYQAIQLRERTINLDPTYGNYHSMLGSLYINLGEYQKAEASIQKALLLQPDDIGGLQTWVRLNLINGDLAEAERTIRNIIPVGSKPIYLR